MIGATVRVGDEFGPLHLPPIDHATLARFAAASGDDNPLHVDVEAARAAGFDDVFAHGMLSMAYLGRLLTQHVPARRLRTFGVRFAAITPVAARPRCRAIITDVVDGVAHAELTVTIDDGTTTLRGRATFEVGDGHPSEQPTVLGPGGRE